MMDGEPAAGDCTDKSKSDNIKCPDSCSNISIIIIIIINKQTNSYSLLRKKKALKKRIEYKCVTYFQVSNHEKQFPLNEDTLMLLQLQQHKILHHFQQALVLVVVVMLFYKKK